MPRPFNSELVITEHISDATFNAYHVGFDQNKFRLQPLVDIIMEVLPEFSLGYYKCQNISHTQIISKLREAARLVYLTDKYQQRGEFGEIILHLLLRDFCNTIPLISKIYFKDSHNMTVHGFDGIHITSENGVNKLWLGESKLYKCGSAGIDSLIKDLKEHLQADYLRNEFELISHKLPSNTPDIEHWRNLLHPHQTLDTIFKSIVIPMVCTYSSDLFKNHNDATTSYFNDFRNEVLSLRDRFDKGKVKIATDIEILLLLLPIPCKDELNSTLDKRLKGLQAI
jgi:hypothetical protein